MTRLPLGVLKNMTLRTTPINVVMSLPKNESRVNVANSNLKSASGDYLTCSDTAQVAV